MPDLCSLHGKIDRLAVSVIWVYSSDFKKLKSVWYGRTVIHNVQGNSIGYRIVFLVSIANCKILTLVTMYSHGSNDVRSGA